METSTVPDVQERSGAPATEMASVEVARETEAEEEQQRESPHPTHQTPSGARSVTADQQQASEIEENRAAEDASPVEEAPPAADERPVADAPHALQQISAEDAQPEDEPRSTAAEPPAKETMSVEESPGIKEEPGEGARVQKPTPPKDTRQPEQSLTRCVPEEPIAETATPANRAAPAEDISQVEKESPAEEVPTAVEEPPVEETALTAEMLGAEEPPADGAPPAEGSPLSEEHPAVEELRTPAEDRQAKEASPINEEPSAAEEVPRNQESSHAAGCPSAEELPLSKEPPPVEGSRTQAEDRQAEEAAPIDEELSAAEHVPRDKEASHAAGEPPAAEEHLQKEEEDQEEEEEAPGKGEASRAAEDPLAATHSSEKFPAPTTKEAMPAEEAPSEEKDPVEAVGGEAAVARTSSKTLQTAGAAAVAAAAAHAEAQDLPEEDELPAPLPKPSFLRRTLWQLERAFLSRRGRRGTAVSEAQSSAGLRADDREASSGKSRSSPWLPWHRRKRQAGMAEAAAEANEGETPERLEAASEKVAEGAAEASPSVAEEVAPKGADEVTTGGAEGPEEAAPAAAQEDAPAAAGEDAPAVEGEAVPSTAEAGAPPDTAETEPAGMEEAARGAEESARASEMLRQRIEVVAQEFAERVRHIAAANEVVEAAGDADVEAIASQSTKVTPRKDEEPSPEMKSSRGHDPDKQAALDLMSADVGCSPVPSASATTEDQDKQSVLELIGAGSSPLLDQDKQTISDLMNGSSQLSDLDPDKRRILNLVGGCSDIDKDKQAVLDLIGGGLPQALDRDKQTVHDLIGGNSEAWIGPGYEPQGSRRSGWWPHLPSMSQIHPAPDAEPTRHHHPSQPQRVYMSADHLSSRPEGVDIDARRDAGIVRHRVVQHIRNGIELGPVRVQRVVLLGRPSPLERQAPQRCVDANVGCAGWSHLWYMNAREATADLELVCDARGNVVVASVTPEGEAQRRGVSQGYMVHALNGGTHAVRERLASELSSGTSAITLDLTSPVPMSHGIPTLGDQKAREPLRAPCIW